ncbi:putative cell polarity protein [Naematelia encephala]|uniref:Putative cell polarity protein n=1 Tax=Naematelia encephala TaxID=71784 RepID=A0A1Y2AUW9_9TREE|nr:putative cell polarity protein [Naematelia encephala]
MEIIEIPQDLEDEEYDFSLPSLAKSSFGSSSADISDAYVSRTGSFNDPAIPTKLGGPSTTPTRPILPKASASYSAGTPTPNTQYASHMEDRSRFGKHSNGSSTSIATPGTSLNSNQGFLRGKGSLASIKNAFKSSSTAAGPSLPPVPTIDTKHAGGYPALRNPFSRLESVPISPTASSYRTGSRGKTSSPAPSAYHSYGERKQSTATNHSSNRSQGGRSATSQGSSSFRVDEHSIPALPPIPTRATPSSRMGRHGSEAGSFFGFGRRHGSISEEDMLDRTPGEEALRIVYRNFADAANMKISRICARPLNTQPVLTAYLEPGVDESFDSSVTSLVQCARRHARRVVDLLSGWTKGHCEGIGASEVRAHLDRALGLQMRVEDAAAILGARKSSAARYVLNRALIEMIKTVPRDAIGEDLGMSLEQNAFNTYRAEKLDENAQFSHRKAVSNMQIELLGELSTTRFLTVSDRFTRELSMHATSAQPTKDTEIRIEHLLRAMRHLKLRVYPENELEMSSEFINQLAAFFANAHGQTLKCAYAETLTALLHPVIEAATAEVNHPMWSKAIGIILSRALAMAQKPRYWHVAFPLVVVSLSVSPREVFMQYWQSCIDSVLAKMKDRNLRVIAINSFIRLLWVYLNRCSESATSLRKRLDPLIRTFFTSSGLYPSDLPLGAFYPIAYYTMVKQLDLGEELISEFLRDPQRASVDAASLDRTTALVQAVSCTLRTVELDNASKWPKSDSFGAIEASDTEATGDVLSPEVLERPDVASFLSRFSSAATQLLLHFDRIVSALVLSSDAVHLSASASNSMDQTGEMITRKHGDIHVSYPSRYTPSLRLLSTLIGTLPRCLSPSASFPDVANILCRATFSADPAVCVAACEAMRRVARDPAHCHILATTYGQFIFETRHIFRDTFVGSRLLETQFERVVALWYDLLQILVDHQRSALAEVAEGEATTPPTVSSSVIDKVDGCGLFLLCSSSLALRRLGGQVLVAARDLEGQARRPSAAFRYSRINPNKAILSRAAQLYEGNCEEADIAAMRQLPWCTASDRHRLDSAVTKDGQRLLQRIAESDQSKDGQLWLSILPFFVARLQAELSGPAAELRSIVASTALRLQGHVATIASTNAARATPGMRASPAVSGRTASDTAVLADHWRAYMCVLCGTMPTSQTLPTTPPVQRTKEAVILTPETISSPALFHYLTSVLGWEDPRFKDAAVYALGSIGPSLLRPLSDILLSLVRRLADGTTASARDPNRRMPINNSLWTASAHVFRLVSPLLLDARSGSHLASLSSMIGFVKFTHTLLSDRHVKEDYDLQSLRRSFCIVVENLTNALAKLDSPDRFLGDEMRGAVFKLCYEWCHVGRRPDVARARESYTLQTAADNYRGERDRAQYLDDFQAKTKLLSAAAAEAMAGLCQGKLISANEATPEQQASDHLVEPLTVLRWIRGMFTSSSAPHHETGRKALYSLLKYNWSCNQLLDEVLHQSFGEGEQFTLDSSFFGVVAAVLAERLVELPIEQLACLALSKLGHPATDIRQRAFQLVEALDPTARKELSKLLPAVGSAAPSVYRKAQRQLAMRLADTFADNAPGFLSECTNRLSQLEAPRRQATLSILPPWLEVLEVAAESNRSPEDATIDHQILSNLMYIAVRFSDDHLDDIQEIFLAFAGSTNSRNTTALVKYLFEQGSKRRSPEFVTHAQRIMACLAQSEAGSDMFEEICNFVEPSAMAALPEADVPPSPMTSLANLDTLMSAPSARSQSFSTGQLALLFAGELLPHQLDDMELSSRLPTLLHIALVHSDHASSALREQCQSVLFQVLRVWICDMSNVPQEDAPAIWSTAELKTNALAKSRSTTFWKVEDDSATQTALSAPTKMVSFIMKVLGILLPLQPRIRQQWGELALAWATSCPIRHLACRSFQVFRILSPRVNPRMVSDTLARLSSTVGSSSPEIQIFNQEVLKTFASIVRNLSSTDVQIHPQIFWCAVACLTTPFENEFLEVVDLLSHLLDKTNLSDPSVAQQLLSFRPPDWVGPPPHLQSLLLVGLRSSKTALMTFDLIRRLASAPYDELIDPAADRLLHGFIAALPWMLQSADLGEPNEDLAMMALDLAAIADAQNNPGFSRLLTSFARVKFRSKDDFIRQAASLLRDFMPTHGLEILTLLLGFVLNTEDWMREKGMQVLKLLLQFPEARGPLATHGNELLQPLLRLVPTKHSSLALDVLDLPISTSNSDNPTAGEIFGPIEPSGWSVAKAKELSALTRENVTAVFNTCAVETRAASAHFSVVQFADLRSFNPNPSQVSLDPPSSPITSGDNASMGDLVGALHSLGQFFDDGLDEVPGSASTTRSPRAVRRGHRQVPSESISERRVRAIMARGRNPSISSPIYESPPGSYPNGRGKHRHNLSELSSADSIDSASVSETQQHTQRLQGYRAGLRLQHHTAASFSSMASSTDTDADPDRSENLFALEEAGNASSISFMSDTPGSTNQSTPVMVRK